MAERYVTLIGSPLNNSFAAPMHNAAYAAMGLPLRYTYTETPAHALAETVERLRGDPLCPGFAVTMPNKVAVLPLLDALDPLCAAVGACNTVVRRGDRLVGYNTDAEGFLRSFTQEGGVAVAGGRFFCMGAGGAGRALCVALVRGGAAAVYVNDPIFSRAEALARESGVDAVHDFSALGHCDALLNASGVGGCGREGELPLDPALLRPGLFCYDTCYNPRETAFLRAARERGCAVCNGLGMSLYQGCRQIELWTARPAPEEIMRAQLLRLSGGAA